MNRIAVIPARGGSKRIPRKNIREFCGRPLIGWSIEAALDSGLFDRIIVSTDDEEIAEVARSEGAEVPFMRPDRLADDYTGTGPVIRHAVEWVLEHGERPDYICTIYATAPFVRAEDLKEGLAKLREADDAHKSFSVTSFPFPIQRAIRITGEGRVEMFQPEHEKTRSQDLEEAYHDAGQFYWSTLEGVLEDVPTFSHASVPVILPRHRVQDIDTPEDWKSAERLFRVFQHSSKS
ncbi:MAG: pseudaminic acid cytidylyltransferase [Balneolaceae bacterium]|nr:pseudaminic acid cytidylyltransferase [Balneolaceae bacterium]